MFGDINKHPTATGTAVNLSAINDKKITKGYVIQILSEVIYLCCGPYHTLLETDESPPWSIKAENAWTK